jgi:hypothetical protein
MVSWATTSQECGKALHSCVLIEAHDDEHSRNVIHALAIANGWILRSINAEHPSQGRALRLAQALRPSPGQVEPDLGIEAISGSLVVRNARSI